MMLEGFILFLILVLVSSTSNENDHGSKQRLFLHIGPHKTASTYIQSVLSSEVIQRYGYSTNNFFVD